MIHDTRGSVLCMLVLCTCIGMGVVSHAGAQYGGAMVSLLGYGGAFNPWALLIDAGVRAAAAIASPIPFFPFESGVSGFPYTILDTINPSHGVTVCGNLGYGDILLGILQANAGFFNPSLGMSSSLGAISQLGENTFTPFAVATLSPVGSILYIPFLPIFL